MNADPEVMACLGPPLTRVQSDAFVERIEGQFERLGHGLWALEVRDTGEFVGFTGLAVQTYEAVFTPCLEVGWRLARAAWGHGYATEAGRAALDAAFDRVGASAVLSIRTRVNDRSRRVMERLGMERVAAYDHEQRQFPPGHPLRPAVAHRITRRERDAAVEAQAQPPR